MQYIHRPVENFQNNAMIISPPINNELYDSLGDESWLRNTAANFNNEDFEYMQALNGVETIKSIPSVTGRAGSYSFYTEDRIYKYEQTLNYQSLDYAKFGLEEYKENDEFSPVSLQNLIYPHDFASNTPYVSTAIGGKIIAGNYPSDNSNQILIDVYSAIYLATQNDKANIEDLLGESITVPLTDDNVQYEWEFQISGIYVADNVGESVIYASYDPKAEIVQRNDCSLYPDKESIEYGRCLKNDANFDLDVELTAEKEAEIGDYAAIYIKVRDDEAEKQVYEKIKKYDPYIYIDSNYGRAQSTSFVYFKHYYQKLVLLLLLTIISFSIIIFGIKKLLEVEFAKIDKTLILFAFKTQEIQKIKQREYRYLNIMYILFICIYLFIYNLQFGFDWKYIILIIGINILLMLIMNMILRGDIKWRRK